MPAITTLIAVAGVAAAVGGVVQTQRIAFEQSLAAKKKADLAKAALLAKPPAEDTKAKIALATKDKELKRGQKGGSLAKRKRASLIGGLEGPTASEVGGLGRA